MNGAMPIRSTLFDFHPFEAHRVGGIVVVTHVARTPGGVEKRTFAALGTCLDDEVKLVGTYRRHRSKKERGIAPLSADARKQRNAKKNAARARRRQSVKEAT